MNSTKNKLNSSKNKLNSKKNQLYEPMSDETHLFNFYFLHFIETLFLFNFDFPCSLFSFIYLFIYFSPQMYNNIIKHTLKFQIVINRKLQEYTQKKEPRASRLVWVYIYIKDLYIIYKRLMIFYSFRKSIFSSLDESGPGSNNPWIYMMCFLVWRQFSPSRT